MKIPEAMLQRARQAARDTMPDTGTIYRRTLADDGEGGQLATYEPQGTAVYRLSKHQQGKDVLSAGMVVAEQEWVLLVPYDTGLRGTDRFKAADGQMYEVTSNPTLVSYPIVQRVLVKQV